jgi:hypothetical protein
MIVSKHNFASLLYEKEYKMLNKKVLHQIKKFRLQRQSN